MFELKETGFGKVLKRVEALKSVGEVLECRWTRREKDQNYTIVRRSVGVQIVLA